jgi:hypothetical protein
MKKKNSIGLKITGWAMGALAVIALLAKILGLFGKSYEMVKDVQGIPALEARVDTVVVEQKVLKKSFEIIDGKLNVMLQRWNIPIPPDSG